MSRFAYTAVDASGKSVKGSLDADNQQLVLSKLQEQGYHVTNLAERRKPSFSVGGMSRFKKLRLQSLVVFSRQFATMINAGVSIIKCLDILENQTKDGVLKPVLGQAMRDVKSGLSLTDAFSKHTNVFSKLYINMIRAAELGGILDEILDRISGFLESEMEIRSKIKSAMMYPIIVLIFSCGMICALFAFVLPKFKEIFISMDVQMPIYTRLLFDGSSLFKSFWYIPLGAIVGAIFSIRYAGSKPAGRYYIDNFKLRVPVVGDIVQKMAISRFARTFGTLVSSGVPMMRALEIVGETSGNSVIAKAVETARQSVREGQKISAPLEGTGLFPAMVIHMIDVGEETGRLSEMLIKVSEFYEREVESAVKGLTSLIEPALIVFMGGMVGFIAISVMGPIFKLVSSIG
ncbi:MAG TPA: type II secretion system F family protein [Armatimonadota bacterium]|nr:type II secretion system F family protein [Armatimonadota bacterium]